MLRFDPESGHFYWIKKCGKRSAGSKAGTSNQHGYWRICLMGRYFMAHRLAWLFIHGTWPDGFIDHIDHQITRNVESNLREASKSTNAQNSLATRSLTGFRGVSWHAGHRKYRARIAVNGKQKVIGYYDTPEEAYSAYLERRKVVHPFAPETAYTR